MKQIIFYNNKNIISKRLKSARESKNLSQSDLAATLQTMNVNIDQQMISKIEKNLRQVTDYEVAAICKCLDVSFEWITADFKHLFWVWVKICATNAFGVLVEFKFWGEMRQKFKNFSDFSVKTFEILKIMCYTL